MKSDEDGVMKSDEEEEQSDENGVRLSEVIYGWEMGIQQSDWNCDWGK